jgi:hypothetical protein
MMWWVVVAAWPWNHAGHYRPGGLSSAWLIIKPKPQIDLIDLGLEGGDLPLKLFLEDAQFVVNVASLVRVIAIDDVVDGATISGQQRGEE